MGVILERKYGRVNGHGFGIVKLSSDLSSTT